MIFYNNKKIDEQIKYDYKELENYKNSYNKRISLYNTYLDTIEVFEDGIIEENNLNIEEMKNKKQIFQTQINKIDRNLELLMNLQKNIDLIGNIGVEKRTINKYNQKYKEIRNNYIENSVFEEQITEKYINGLTADLAKTLERIKEEHIKEIEQILVEKTNIQYVKEQKKNVINDNNIIEENINKDVYLKNNNTLLISEKIGKVVLPYRAEEVLEILDKEKNKYRSAEDVIEDKFTRDLSDFKIQFASRYVETIKLARERENYNFIDAIVLATEMMKKNFLHPAIISACKSLNELDVYLDCLDKNELDDFKIFKVKYELFPMVVKQNKTRRGKRYKNDSKTKIIKKFFKNNKDRQDKNIYDV